MPGMYAGDDYDLAGFCVGVVEKESIIDGSRVEAGNALIGIQSSGLHSNGYSLVHKILSEKSANLGEACGDQTLGEALLAPTKIYVQAISALLEKFQIHAMAHITGGGLLENLPRVLPDNLQAKLTSSQWEKPAVFDWIQQFAIDEQELYRTFNCGLGMVLCVAKSDVSDCLTLLQSCGETAWQIGEVADRSESQPSVLIE